MPANTMDLQYGGVLIFLLLGLAFAVAVFFFSFIFRENGTDPKRRSIYECGMDPIGTPYVSPNIRFYIFALVFVVFDVEAVFVFPWAVKYKELGILGLVEMGIFLFFLIVGLVYEWRRGALKWE